MSAIREASNAPYHTVKDVYIEVYGPTNRGDTNPDFTITRDDIESIELSARLSEHKDEGTLTIHNNDGEYTDELLSGTRVELFMDPGLFDNWGEGSWGLNGWGGGVIHVFTGMVRDREFEFLSPERSMLTVSIEDFVSAVLSKRLVFDSWSGERIDTIVTSVVEDEAAGEIETGRIADIPTTTTIASDGEDALDFMVSLARRAGAVFYGRRRQLVFEPLAEATDFIVLDGDDIGPFSSRESDTGLVNSVRVDGATNPQVDDEQLTVSAYAAISDTTRVMTRIDTRKAMVDQVEIWTRKTGSEEAITVRLQKDDGTGNAPIAVDDTTSDIISRSLEHHFLDDDGFTTYELGDHTLPEPRPWLIVESDGIAGQQVGVNGEGTLAYRSYYDYPLTVTQTDLDSQITYRRREERIKADHVDTTEGATALAQEVLDHDSVPEREVAFAAESLRAMDLRVGQSVTFDFEREATVGDYIVTERSITGDQGTLAIDLLAVEIDSI